MQAEPDLSSTLQPPPEIYQLHFLLLEISPAISRRLLVRSDCTIYDLHFTSLFKLPSAGVIFTSTDLIITLRATEFTILAACLLIMTPRKLP